MANMRGKRNQNKKSNNHQSLKVFAKQTQKRSHLFFSLTLSFVPSPIVLPHGNQNQAAANTTMHIKDDITQIQITRKKESKREREYGTHRATSKMRMQIQQTNKTSESHPRDKQKRGKRGKHDVGRRRVTNHNHHK